MPDSPVTVSIRTIGCRLNQAESAQIGASLKQAGYRVLRPGAAVDVCVIHGCAVTAKAFKDTRMAARAAARTKPRPFIVVAGCAAVFDGVSLLNEKTADFVADQPDKFRLPEILAKNGFPPACLPGCDALPFFDRTRAIIKAQDGCNFGCAYCIVPALRGSPQSRPMPEILREITALAEAGCREFVLTGANLGCYRDKGRGLVALLERIEALPGLERVRLSSIEISTAERAVADFLAGSRVFCRYLHLPLQSGDDRVLAAMGRRYTRRQYASAVEYLFKKVGSMGLGADVMTGFPGEDDAAFEATCGMLKDLPFSRLHVFAFSPRPGTRAAAMSGQAPSTLIRERTARLREIAAARELEFAASLLGKKISVLVEGRALPDCSGQGWSREYVRARVAGAGASRNSVFEVVPDRLEGVCLVAENPEKQIEKKKGRQNGQINAG